MPHYYFKFFFFFCWLVFHRNICVFFLNSVRLYSFIAQLFVVRCTKSKYIVVRKFDKTSRSNSSNNKSIVHVVIIKVVEEEVAAVIVTAVHIVLILVHTKLVKWGSNVGISRL